MEILSRIARFESWEWPAARLGCTNHLTDKRQIHLVEYLGIKNPCDYEIFSKQCYEIRKTVSYNEVGSEQYVLNNIIVLKI